MIDDDQGVTERLCESAEDNPIAPFALSPKLYFLLFDDTFKELSWITSSAAWFSQYVTQLEIKLSSVNTLLSNGKMSLALIAALMFEGVIACS